MGVIAKLISTQNWVLSRRGWARCGVAFASGGVSALAMAPFFLWPILFATLSVVVWLLDSAQQTKTTDARNWFTMRWLPHPMWQAFRDGWWFGFGYFLFGLFWIAEPFLVEFDKFAWLIPFAVTLLPAGLALFFGFATALASQFWWPGLARVLMLAVAFAGAEWLRGNILTGLPWNTLGYALTQPLILMQSAAVFGIYGLTLWVVVICASPAVLAADGASHKGRNARPYAGVVLAGVLLSAAIAFGWWQLSTALPKNVAGVKLRLVQPSISQRDKWAPDKRDAIFNGLLALSQTDSGGTKDNAKDVTHVIWPEAAIPFLILRTPAALRAIADMLPDETHLLTGALRYSEDVTTATPVDERVAFNSLMAFNGLGLLVGLTDKTHLVPFGEYLPLAAGLETHRIAQVDP